MTVVQRFGGGLNLNIHFHTLLFDGVFHTPDEWDTLHDEVGVALDRIAARVQHLLKGRGLIPPMPTFRADPDAAWALATPPPGTPI